jgi:GTP-binding protein LepA
VIYEIELNDGTVLELHNPADMPDVVRIKEIREPWIRATILTPDDYLGAVLKLCQDRRGTQIELTYVGSRAMVTYDLPLNEVVFDFYDRLKSISKGYASFDYQITDYRVGDLVKMSILVNAEPVDALSMLVHRARAEYRGRAMCEKLKDLIPQHLFQIPIQAAIGAKIIARETIRALRKDVTCQVLRRRHHPQAQASREAEGGQKKNEADRLGRGPARGLPRRVEGGRLSDPPAAISAAGCARSRKGRDFSAR